MFLAQLYGFVFVLSTATVWNFGFEWKMDGSAYNCLSSSELVVFLGDSFCYHCSLLKGFLNHGWMVVFMILGFN
jgi:hypothetical protein